MNNLYELRDKLCSQLKEYNKRELTSSTLDIVDKLTHTLKNLDKIIDRYEKDEYGASYARPYTQRYNMYDDGSSYRRGNVMDDGGRYANGYSRHNDMIRELTNMMENSSDERIRTEFQKFIQKMQDM